MQSQDTNSSSIQTMSVKHDKNKIFEPVLGVEIQALIKRAFIFVSDENFDEAERYFEQALRQDPEAQFKLGLMYYNGQNVKRDYEQAFYWLNKAAKQGHEEAKEALEKFNAKNLNVQELEEFKSFLNKAAERGNKYAIEKLKELQNSEKTMQQSSKSEPAHTEKDDYVELNPKIFTDEDDREAQATINAYTFEEKINELANQISSSNKYSYQNMELVEGNTMVDDEIVYMRAWQGKGYFFIRNYENKSWSNNYLTHFYINDKSNVNFSGRIKVGCTLDDLTAVFGDKLEWSSERPSEWTLTTRANWIMNFYISSKGYVNEIQYKP